jgi:hypothetical protein
MSRQAIDSITNPILGRLIPKIHRLTIVGETVPCQVADSKASSKLSFAFDHLPAELTDAHNSGIASVNAPKKSGRLINFLLFSA